MIEARDQSPLAGATSEDRIAIVDLADDLQVRKQRIFKILPRLGIHPTQRREPSRGNQNVATVSVPEAAAIRAEIASSVPADADRSIVFPDDFGVFYVIQLEPQHDPGRVKVGFTTNIDGRLQKHRCSAPFAQCRKTWPCKRVWERAAIDCATRGCEPLHNEVFRARSAHEVVAAANSFFGLMPAPNDSSEPS